MRQRNTGNRSMLSSPGTQIRLSCPIPGYIATQSVYRSRRILRADLFAGLLDTRKNVWGCIMAMYTKLTWEMEMDGNRKHFSHDNTTFQSGEHAGRVLRVSTYFNYLLLSILNQHSYRWSSLSCMETEWHSSG